MRVVFAESHLITHFQIMTDDPNITGIGLYLGANQIDGGFRNSSNTIDVRTQVKTAVDWTTDALSIDVYKESPVGHVTVMWIKLWGVGENPFSPNC